MTPRSTPKVSRWTTRHGSARRLVRSWAALSSRVPSQRPNHALQRTGCPAPSLHFGLLFTFLPCVAAVARQSLSLGR